MHEDNVRAVWECELDRLEIEVIRVERLLKGLSTLPQEPWSPPAIPGQMPEDLAPRAQELLDRQHHVMGRIGQALSSAQEQIAYGGRVAGATAPGPAGPVYLDVHA